MFAVTGDSLWDRVPPTGPGNAGEMRRTNNHFILPLPRVENAVMDLSEVLKCHVVTVVR